MPASGPIDPDRLAATEFSTSFRGYDPAEVRSLLVAVTDELQAGAGREHALREQLARAEDHLRELRETVARDAEQAAADGRQQGREMVAEAQRVRERMLGDLARRRSHARQQVEQLMAGRERLLDAFEGARQTIDEATQDMRTSLSEARMAAEVAGRRPSEDVDGDTAVADLEDEIEAARLAGLPIIDDGVDDGGPAESEGEPARRSEPALLGERDRDMPLVEPSADFEDVRIVPIGGEDDSITNSHADLDEPDADADESDADTRSEGGDRAAGEDSEPEDESAAVAPPEPAAGPAHVDELFASLRAARAEVVVGARSVLAADPAVDADVDTDAGLETDSVADAAELERGSGAGPELAAVVEAATESTDVPPPAEASRPPAVRERVLRESSEALAHALKRLLADEQNELLDRLRTLRRNQSPADDEVLGDASARVERFAAVALGPLAETVAAGVASVVANAPSSANARVRPPATAPMAVALATEVVEPLHDRMRRALDEAGSDSTEATDRVRATFREWKTQRIAAAVADASRAAFHEGVLAGTAKGTGLRWVLDDADEACAECADNALAGTVARGAVYPTGHRLPPAHHGCTCHLANVETQPT